MSWVDRAERALEGRTPPADDLVVLRGRRPPLLDAEGIRAVLAPLLAAIVWSAAIFREQVAETSIDPIAVALRLVALGLTLRVALLGARMLARFSVWRDAPRYALAIAPEGLLFRAPGVDVAVARDDVVGISEHGRWQERPAGRRYADVFVVTRPGSGRTHLALPPVLEETPGLLAERLMRWRAGPDEPEDFEHPPPHDVASRVYDEAAAGRAPEGTAVVRHGRGWLRRGPYLLVLLAVAAGEGLARGGPRVWAAIDPLVGAGLVFVLLAVFARWLWMTRREVSPRRGVSMVLTPSELLVRAHGGMLRTRWADLAGANIATKRSWSVLEGVHDARELVLTRRGAGPIRYEEPYLGIPVEVARILVDAYRSGRLP